MLYAMPNTDNALYTFSPRYENYLGGAWTTPAKGKYFDNLSPINGNLLCLVARSS